MIKMQYEKRLGRRLLYIISDILGFDDSTRRKNRSRYVKVRSSMIQMKM